MIAFRHRGPSWLAALALAFTVATCRAPSSPPVADEQRARPNIVVFMVDDLGWQDVSLPLWTEPTEFNRRYRTPNLERLAAAGVTFTEAHASGPVCTPTRTSLMTGRAPCAKHTRAADRSS